MMKLIGCHKSIPNSGVSKMLAAVKDLNEKAGRNGITNSRLV